MTPVVDEGGVLLGRITIDDVVDVIVEDAERDYQLASGISEDVEGKDSVWTPMTRAATLAVDWPRRRNWRRLRHRRL